MTQKAYSSGSTFPTLGKDTIRLYSSRICPYAQRARLVLAHKDIPHEVVNVNLQDKPEWFLSRAPAGKVPVLETADNYVLYESTAICEFLDDTQGDTKLQPALPLRKAQDRILLEAFSQVTSAFYAILFGHKKEEKKEEVTTKVEQLHTALGFFEKELGKRGTCYFGGPQPAMIDFYLWPHLERIPSVSMMVPEVSLDKARFPRLSEWRETMTKVPAVRKEMHDPDWHFQVFQLMMQGRPSSDHGLED